MLLTTAMVVRAFDFSALAPTGQMLNYTITSATTVTVAAGSPKPAGRLTIPDTVRGYYVTAVANSGFSDCRGLLSVNIPGSVATIGTRAFSGCESMTSAYLAEGVQTIGQMAFSSCTALDTVSLPTTLTQISAGSFGNTAVLNRREHWQDSVLYVGNYLIASMPQRTGTIVLADGTLGIANIAFDNCNIAKCVVPQGFHFIGDQAFMSCTHLDTVHMLDTVPPTLAANAFQGASSNLIILVPCGSAAAYNAASSWSSLTIVEDTCPTPPTPPVPPDPPVGLQTADAQPITATVDGNILTVSGAEGLPVTVTDVAGRRILSSHSAQRDMRIALPAKGIYIVSVGTSAPLKVCYSR